MVNNTPSHAFRTFVINLLDDPHGIDKTNYNELVNFATRNYPNLLDDVWAAVSGGENRIYLEENTAEDLRNTSR
jgi:hypothetical protein